LAISSPRRRILYLTAIALALGAGLLAYRSREPGSETPIPGVVHETEVQIAPEITGRLVSVLVTAGQEVQKGEVLALLSNPELAASVGESKAALGKSRSDRANVYAGVRKEEVDISSRDVQIAESNLVLAQQQYERAAALAARNFASKQHLDETTATLRKSEANLTALREAQARNRAGPTKEELASADAQVALADAAVANLEAKHAKTKLLAPFEGTVRIVVANEGEVISPGQAVLTLAAGKERWFTFTIREDRLKATTIGSTLRLLTANGGTITGRVTELRPLGEFATWRAARASGDHDLNSFLVRVDPVAASGELEPGMTVWIEPGDRSHSKERS
jgi:HlyD family secretion protein